MNRFFFTLIILSLPVFCSAQGFRMTSGEYWFLVIIGVISILLFAAVLVIMLLNWLENRKSRKNKQQSPPAQDKKALFELKQELKEKKEVIDSLNEQIDELRNDKKDLQNVIDDLEKRLSFLGKKENEKSKEVIKSQNRSEIRLNIKEESERYSQDNGFIYLTVLEGPLVEARPEHIVYYKAWREKGKLLFEFVNNDKTKKAINNRTSIIEPFCEKVESSKSPDDSEMITTISPGLLNDDYTVRDKAKIEYK